MSGELAKPIDLRERVEQRIRDTIADLIPEDQWKDLIEKSIARFMAPTTKSDGYRTWAAPSELDRIVHGKLSEFFAAKIQEFITSPEFQGEWQGNGFQGGELVKQVCRDRAGDILATVFGKLFADGMSKLAQELVNQTKFSIANGA